MDFDFGDYFQLSHLPQRDEAWHLLAWKVMTEVFIYDNSRDHSG